jgi:GT2 family glycosyltransferase
VPKVFVVLLNWNGWRDTIECLESVFRLNYPDFAVILCDNASSDGSTAQIERWARGEIAADCANSELRHFVDPPVKKPIRYSLLNARESPSIAGKEAQLYVLQTGENLGFAGGINAGLRLALAAGGFDFVWILNNDTIIDPGALSAMVGRMTEKSDAGICGSTLLYYHEPRTIQALGGSAYNRWTARGGHLWAGVDSNRIPVPALVEQKMQYVTGASMLVRRQFVEDVGLMSEEYFLYFEEIDWATRAKGKYGLAYAPRSVVYHKEGATIGTARRAALNPVITDYYATRNRLLFTSRFYPAALPTVIASICLSFFHRIALGRFQNAAAILKSCIGSFHSDSGKRYPFDRTAEVSSIRNGVD